MSLADQALIPLPNIGVALTCHVATWYWAALEAQALKMSTTKTPLTILNNIAAMNPAAQPKILLLPKSGHWDFNITPTTPPVGSVLIWTSGGTHSAIVTDDDDITGYNQVVQFPHLIPNTGHTTANPAQLSPLYKQCIVVAQTTLIGIASTLDL